MQLRFSLRAQVVNCKTKKSSGPRGSLLFAEPLLKTEKLLSPKTGKMMNSTRNGKEEGNLG